MERELEDWSDKEIREEYFYRFGRLPDGDIVTDMNLEEMSKLFLFFSPQKQQNIINLLKDDKI